MDIHEVSKLPQKGKPKNSVQEHQLLHSVSSAVPTSEPRIQDQRENRFAFKHRKVRKKNEAPTISVD